MRSSPKPVMFKKMKPRTIFYDLFSKLFEAIVGGEDTSPLWRNIFQHVKMDTKLEEGDQEKIRSVFRKIAASQKRKELISAFMKELRRSWLSHPQITRHFLSLILPEEHFPKSIHRYAHWKKLGPVIDYLRYMFFLSPRSKFQEQLVDFDTFIFTEKTQKQMRSLLPKHVRYDPRGASVHDFITRLNRAKSNQQEKLEKEIFTLVDTLNSEPKLSVNDFNDRVANIYNQDTDVVRKFLKIFILEHHVIADDANDANMITLSRLFEQFIRNRCQGQKSDLNAPLNIITQHLSRGLRIRCNNYMMIFNELGKLKKDCRDELFKLAESLLLFQVKLALRKQRQPTDLHDDKIRQFSQLAKKPVTAGIAFATRSGLRARIKEICDIIKTI